MILLFWWRRTQHLAGMQDSADKQRDRRFVRDRIFLWGSLARIVRRVDNAKIIKRRRRGGGSGTEWIVCLLASRGPTKSSVSLKCSFLKDFKDDRCLSLRRRIDPLTSISLARMRGARPLRRRPPSQRTSSGRGCGWRSSTAKKRQNSCLVRCLK